MHSHCSLERKSSIYKLLTCYGMHSIQSQSNIYIIVMYSAAFIYVQHVNQFIVRTHIIYTLSIQISRFFWGGISLGGITTVERFL
jgi:hypothetical protein